MAGRVRSESQSPAATASTDSTFCSHDITAASVSRAPSCGCMSHGEWGRRACWQVDVSRLGHCRAQCSQKGVQAAHPHAAISQLGAFIVLGGTRISKRVHALSSSASCSEGRSWTAAWPQVSAMPPSRSGRTTPSHSASARARAQNSVALRGFSR